MLLSQEQKAALWLSFAEVSSKRAGEFRENYHSLAETWEAFGTASGPQFRDTSGSILKKYHSDDAMEQLAVRLQDCHVHLLFDTDEQYPEILRQIENPPYLLYYAGNLECLKSPKIAIVGTRHPSRYGTDVAAALSRDLCKAGICVVSGLARGIDASTHVAAVQSGGQTIGVLGSGLNVPYPKEHIQLLRDIAGGKGLILTEYPLDANPVAYHFPHRNRIISGLSRGVVLVEGRIRSGGMNTVGIALNQGREVFAVPGRIGTECAEGPLAILREGARVITCADDLLADLGLKTISKEESNLETLPSLTVTQLKLKESMKNGPVSIEQISAESGLSADIILSELTVMEIEGVVVRENGNRYQLPLTRKR